MPPAPQKWIPTPRPLSAALIPKLVWDRFKANFERDGDCWVWRGHPVWQLNGVDYTPRTFAIELYGSPARLTPCNTTHCMHPGHRPGSPLPPIVRIKRRLLAESEELRTRIDKELLDTVMARVKDENISVRAYLERAIRAELGQA
jgi:hypothetical protein